MPRYFKAIFNSKFKKQNSKVLILQGKGKTKYQQQQKTHPYLASGGLFVII